MPEEIIRNNVSITYDGRNFVGRVCPEYPDIYLSLNNCNRDVHQRRITMNEFIKKFDGKSIDFDHVYGSQCVDLVKLWEDWNGWPVITGNAKDQFRDVDGYTRIRNTPSGVPQQGDIIIWDESVNKYGHIAIFVKGDSNQFVSFDQNWPVGSVCHLQKHYYGGVLGWLRFKKGDDMTKFELFSDHRDIYVRLWGNFLVHIPSPEELTKYFGSNPQIQEVDDIHQAGIVASEIANRLGQLESDLARMTSQKDEQLAKNADLVSKITTCNHLFADESDKNSELQKEIDLQGKTIDKLKIQIKELQKNKPKIEHSWLWYSWLRLWRYIISKLGKEKK